MSGDRYIIVLWGQPTGPIYERREDALTELVALRAALKRPDECYLLECTPVALGEHTPATTPTTHTQEEHP